MGLLSMQHQPQHQQQGHTPSQQHLHNSRPSSVVQQHQAHAQPQQPPSAYSATSHGLAPSYQHGSQTSSSNQENIPYYNHQSPYSTPGAASGYTSAGMTAPFRVTWAVLETRQKNKTCQGDAMLTFMARNLRDDGRRSNTETAPLPAHVVSHTAVQLACVCAFTLST